MTWSSDLHSLMLQFIPALKYSRNFSKNTKNSGWRNLLSITFFKFNEKTIGCCKNDLGLLSLQGTCLLKVIGGDFTISSEI